MTSLCLRKRAENNESQAFKRVRMNTADRLFLLLTHHSHTFVHEQQAILLHPKHSIDAYETTIDIERISHDFRTTVAISCKSIAGSYGQKYCTHLFGHVTLSALFVDSVLSGEQAMLLSSLIIFSTCRKYGEMTSSTTGVLSYRFCEEKLCKKTRTYNCGRILVPRTQRWKTLCQFDCHCVNLFIVVDL